VEAAEAVILSAGLPSYEWAPRYSTSRDDLIAAFYKPAIDRSIGYDRAVGFFRSSFFSIAGAPTASFALRGGRVRLLCSPDLTEEDAAAIKRGIDMQEVIDEAARRELDRVLAFPLARPAVELLAALVAERVLDIRFGVRREGPGIFHYKVGVFRDAEKNRLSFSGSVNETWQGWHPLGNHESFEVFQSWVTADSERVSDHVAYFDRLWSGNADGLEVYEAPRAFRDQLLRFAPPREEGLRSMVAGKTPRPRSLFDHQLVGIENWKASGYRGILQHATGSGKTLTALHAARDWLTEFGPVLIVVPSTLLLQQWYAEAERELAFLEPSVLLVGGGHDEWRNSSLLRVHTEPGDDARVTIATVQTASTDKFMELVRGGDHLLLIADEVHRLGSEKFRNVLTLQSGGRLGLSATPIRVGDEQGTAAVLEYFGGVIDPAFSLHDAIAAGRLCPYEYYVHLVDLTEHEAREYRDLTTKIGQAMGTLGGESGSSGYLEFLLIQRARIVKQAAAKAPAAAEIVEHDFRDGEHWLVYCDNQHQVRDVIALLRDKAIDAFEYHSEMQGDREATMSHFRAFGGVLVAIRCLDEGVDLPEVSHAVIAASSKNEREFIQRRGRVLRASPGKRLAVVHDLLVRPPHDDSEGERSPFTAIAEAELGRAAAFARDAVNLATRNQLVGLCIDWDIDPDGL